MSSQPSRRVLLAAVLALVVAAAVPVGDAAAAAYSCDGRAATWVGTDGDDVFTDTVGSDDVIVALDGNDFIYTGDGNDVVCAGEGVDVVYGGEGADRIFGEGWGDFLHGQGGDDVISGGAGSDVIEGGSGSDYIAGDAGNDELWGSSCLAPAGLSHFCRVEPAPSSADSGGGDAGNGGGDGGAGGDYAALLQATRTLRWGSTGDDVTALQRLLNDLGFGAGLVDGKFGQLTAAAVRDFQSTRGLAVDGAVGPQTRAALADAAAGTTASVAFSAPAAFAGSELFGSSRLLRVGISGDDVAALQRYLADLGFAVGTIDGVFGAQTAAAVRAFQQQHGLPADGVVGPQTKAVMAGDPGGGDQLVGGADFDTCNSPDEGTECESKRGLRSGAPRDASAAEEWRPLVSEVFTAWGLGHEIERALAIVACESLADPFITTPSSPEGSSVVGLFQHKDIYWANRAANAGLVGGDIFSPRDNTVVAAYLVAQSVGTTNGPWSHFHCGSILGFWTDGG